MIPKEEIINRIRLAFAQYETIDKNKHETFGTLLQGIIFIKINNKTKYIPFSINNEGDIYILFELVKKIESVDSLRICLAQHYIHYE